MQHKPPLRLYLIITALLLCMTGMIVQLFSVINRDYLAEAGVRQGTYHLHVPMTSGVIYDRSMHPLNQSEDVVLAVVNPTPDTIASIFTKLRDRDAVSAQLQNVSPFVCELTEETESGTNLRILHGTRDPEGALPAQHLLGYRQNGECVAGLEKSCADWLRRCDTSADVTFTVSATGEVLAGADSSFRQNGTPGGGIVTTLDADIQQITEQILSEALPEAGAAVVLDAATGEIRACASLPVYAPDALSDAMEDAQSPFLNRALSAYSVGSVFKLVTASTALEQGFNTRYMYECEGQITVYGQRFRCHNLNGHGLLDMHDALIASCNPYFISLSRLLPADALHDIAASLGFGQETALADGLSGNSGSLPSAQTLKIDAEKANFSFGQGQLLATPLQIAGMTACIANGGVYTPPHLMTGTTRDGETVQQIQQPLPVQVLSADTAEQMRSMMVSVIAESAQSNGDPYNTTAGGKTSTAQTGQYDADGKEYCHAWMTGFFPAEHPRYTVTVFIEKGGSGNQAAAPIFRRIIEAMTRNGL